MDRSLILLFLLALTASGFFKLFLTKKSLERDFETTETYFSNLKKYLSSQGKDNETYSWLIFKSNSMQRALGIYGIFNLYKPPGYVGQYRNYPIVVNLLPELKKAFQDHLFLNNLDNSYADILQETLIRYLGVLAESIDQKRLDMKNPFKLIREGVKLLFALPILVLEWVGILPERYGSKLIDSLLMRIISSTFTIIGLISAVIGIVTGWDSFINIIQPIIFEF